MEDREEFAACEVDGESGADTKSDGPSSCVVCNGGVSSKDAVELSEETVSSFLDALLVEEGGEGRGGDDLWACGDCCKSMWAYLDLFRKLEELRLEFNGLRRRLGSQVILGSLGGSPDFLNGWVEAVKSVEDVFPSGAKERLLRTKNDGGAVEDEVEEQFGLWVDGQVKCEVVENIEEDYDITDPFDLVGFGPEELLGRRGGAENNNLSLMRPVVAVDTCESPVGKRKRGRPRKVQLVDGVADKAEEVVDQDTYCLDSDSDSCEDIKIEGSTFLRCLPGLRKRGRPRTVKPMEVRNSKTTVTNMSAAENWTPCDPLLVKRGRGRPRKVKPLNIDDIRKREEAGTQVTDIDDTCEELNDNSPIGIGVPVLVKRGRGRPRKVNPLDVDHVRKPEADDSCVELHGNSTTCASLIVKRGRGRPRKVKPLDVDEVKKREEGVEQVITLSDNDDISVELNETSTTPELVKRGRGRPRKLKVEVAVEKNEEQMVKCLCAPFQLNLGCPACYPVKRKRGRPRKKLVEDFTEESESEGHVEMLEVHVSPSTVNVVSADLYSSPRDPKRHDASQTSLSGNSTSKKLSAGESLGSSEVPEEQKKTSEVSCTHCDLNFRLPNMLRHHLIRTHGLDVESRTDKTFSRVFMCRYCLKFYLSEVSVEEHVENVHKMVNSREGQERLVETFIGPEGTMWSPADRLQTPVNIHCRICQVPFSTVEELEIHAASEEHKERVRSTANAYCNVCRLSFGGDTGALKVHLKSGDHLEEVKTLGKFNKDTFCVPCRIDCASSKDLKTHNTTRSHKKRCFFRRNLKPRGTIFEGQRNPKQCGVCNESFTLATALEERVKTFHNVDVLHACDICGQTFANLKDFQCHREIHVPNLFICDRCGEVFKEEFDLAMHIENLHAVEKSARAERPTYPCEFCAEVLKSKYEMRRHIYNSHRTTYTEGWHICLVCYNSFPTAEELNGFHMKTHEGLKCPTCGKYFRFKRNLVNHQRIHTGEKPYACNFCDKKFSHHSNLKEHTMRHKGEKPHMCSCGQGFFRNSLFEKHKTSMGH